MRRLGAWFVLCAMAVTSLVVMLPTAGTVDADTVGADIAVSYYHGCVVHDDGGVTCWGRNDDGQLGRGFESPWEAPGRVPGLDDVAEVAVGQLVTCARHMNGTVSCWGNDAYEMLGDGTPGAVHRASPQTVPGISSAVSIDVGAQHVCAALADGTVLCWGYNLFDQLGRDVGFVTDPTPTAVPGLSDVAQVATMFAHTCARTATTGEVWCWGRAAGLGTDISPDTTTHVPQKVPGVSGATAITAGSDHSCAVDAADTVWCWGKNTRGQLGRGDTVGSDTVEPVPGVAAFDVVAGDRHTCAALLDGTLSCWGENDLGQLGDGTLLDTSSPQTVPGITGVVAASAGDDSTCVSTTGGSWCWGDNEFGEADGSGVVINPTPALDETPVDGIAGGRYGMCRWTAAAVECIGSNDGDQLLTGDGAPSDSWVAIAGLPPSVVDVAVGDEHACAVGSSGGVSCWGSDQFGMLGDGAALDSPGPVVPETASGTPVTGGVTDISAAERTTCIVRSGAVACWGVNDHGQVDDSGNYSVATVTPIVGLPGGATRVATGSEHVCAIASGEVWCWGDGADGELGDGNSADSTAPVQVDGITDAIEVTVGDRHSCAIVGTGTVECWGLGARTGAQSAVPAPTPVEAIGISSAVQLSSNVDHTCALESTGLVRCWGVNLQGQLGDGTIKNRQTPRTVIEVAEATAIGGQDVTCALVPAGSMCWGHDRSGSLGAFPFLSVPDQVTLDGDDDGIIDADDNCPITPNADQADLDDDGTGDVCDPDDDGDTIDDTTDNCPTTPNTDQADLDDDGTGDLCDPDDDGDTIDDTTDNCPTTPNTDQADGDLDGIGNACDDLTDPDGDGVDEPVDNCPITANPDQSDIDGDGAGDACDGSNDNEPFVSSTPARFADTRPTGDTVDREYQRTGRVPGGTSLEIEIAGRGGVPDDATAVVVNLTALGADTAGHVTVYPCTSVVPTASTVNYTPGAVTPNEVVARLSPGGTLCVYAHADVHVIVDVVGHVDSGSPYVAIDPTRYADSRDQDTFDGRFRDTGPVPGGSTWRIEVAGRGIVPAYATTAVLNVTAVGPQSAGHATVYPCTDDVPTASSLNYAAGQVRPNEVIAELDADGFVCVATHATSHYVVDVVGYIADTSGHTPVGPSRYGDTRDQDTFDGRFRDIGPVPGGTTWKVPIAGRGTIPSSATSAILNVTAVKPSGAGHLTVYPCTAELPNASHVNYVPGDVRANEVIAKLDGDGNVCIHTHATTHVIVDVTGHNG